MAHTKVSLRISDAALLTLLKRAGKVTASEASELQRQKRRTGDSLQNVAIAAGIVTQKEIAKLHTSDPTETTVGVLSGKPSKRELVPLRHFSPTEFMTHLFEEAIVNGTGSIHLELHGEELVVRQRIDGLMHHTQHLAACDFLPLLAHIKAQAGLQVTEHKQAQEGSFAFELTGVAYYAVVAILPVADGELVTINLTPAQLPAKTFKELGFWGVSLSALQAAVAEDRGLVVVSGPSHSGRSTTFLYILRQLAASGASVTALENDSAPRATGVSQVKLPVNSPLHADIVRAALRHAPDSIGIDQIHTADQLNQLLQIATERFTLATFAGQRAVQTLTRLDTMIDDTTLLSLATHTVVNQRLARRLCNHCKHAHHPAAAELKVVLHTLHVTSAHDLSELQKLQKIAASALIDDDAPIGRLQKADPKGCQACNFTGYKGVIVLNEVLPITSKIREFLAARADSSAIYKQALRDGMVPIEIDALVKVFLGITSIEEILRVL